jgi:hypothetical protein
MDYRGASGYIWTRKTIKYAFILVAVLIFLTVILVEAFVVHRNELHRREMEQIASAALGVRVTIAAYYPHSSSNSVYLSDVRIGSPPGYDSGTALQIAGIGIQGISYENDHFVVKRVILSTVIVYMGIRRDSTNLMPLIAGLKSSELENAFPSKAIIRDVASTVFILRPFLIPPENTFIPVDADNLSMKEVGADKGGATIGAEAAEVLREIMRVAYRSAAKHSYLRPLGANAIEQIQSTLNVDKGFVTLAKEGLVWQGNLNSNSRIRK